MFGHDLSFWMAVAGAVIIKIVTASNRSFLRNLFAVFAAVFSAWQFTDVMLDVFHLDPLVYKYPVAAVLALTGEGLLRWVHTAAQSPLHALGEAVKAWKGVAK